MRRFEHVTKCHSMKPSLPPLGDLEHELLTILWAQGEMTALAVRKHVARKLKDPTIRTVLRRLEEKRYVTHAVGSGTFFYRARETAETVLTPATQVATMQHCTALMLPSWWTARTARQGRTAPKTGPAAEAIPPGRPRCVRRL